MPADTKAVMKKPSPRALDRVLARLRGNEFGDPAITPLRRLFAVVPISKLGAHEQADFEEARQYAIEAVTLAQRCGGLLDPLEVAHAVEVDLWALADLLWTLHEGGGGQNTGRLWRETSQITARLKALQESSATLAEREAERQRVHGDAKAVTAVEVLAVRARQLSEGVEALTREAIPVEPAAVLSAIEAGDQPRV